MKYKVWISCFLCLLAYKPVHAKERVSYHAYSLKNGLQVVIIPNTRAPVVYHSIWYKVGSADSPPGKSGLAHFVEHLMFKGTVRYPKDMFKRIINELGGVQNANTSWDRTTYYVTLSKAHLPQVMEMEADRMNQLVVSEEDILKEREVVLQERRSVIDASPESRLFEGANASFFWEHPYGKPVIGFEEEIRTYSREDALQFYKNWYGPNNAILVIAGDVKVDELKTLIDRYYGAIPSIPLPDRTRLSEPTHRGVVSQVEIRDPKMGGTFLQRIYEAPNFRVAGLRRQAAITLLDDILGDGTQGRLSERLVEDQKLASFAQAGYVGYYRDPYSFTVTAAPLNSSEMLLLDASIEAEINQVITRGVTQSELDTAKAHWIYQLQYQKDSLEGLANYFGESLSVGYSLSDIDGWLDCIKSVTLEEVAKEANTILKPGPIVKAYAYPAVPK